MPLNYNTNITPSVSQSLRSIRSFTASNGSLPGLTARSKGSFFDNERVHPSLQAFQSRIKNTKTSDLDQGSQSEENTRDSDIGHLQRLDLKPSEQSIIPSSVTSYNSSIMDHFNSEARAEEEEGKSAERFELDRSLMESKTENRISAVRVGEL